MPNRLATWAARQDGDQESQTTVTHATDEIVIYITGPFGKFAEAANPPGVNSQRYRQQFTVLHGVCWVTSGIRLSSTAMTPKANFSTALSGRMLCAGRTALGRTLPKRFSPSVDSADVAAFTSELQTVIWGLKG